MEVGKERMFHAAKLAQDKANSLEACNITALHSTEVLENQSDSWQNFPGVLIPKFQILVKNLLMHQDHIIKYYNVI